MRRFPKGGGGGRIAIWDLSSPAEVFGRKPGEKDMQNYYRAPAGAA